MTQAMPQGSDGAPKLSPLEPPEAMSHMPTLLGPPVTPQLRVSSYESGEWEKFIREWATGMSDSYVQIKRIGGSGDAGVDVAAFKSKKGFEGPWDCFQGKHYARELRPSQAYPEILKVFLGVLGGHYIMPDTYAFLAPKGCGTTLDRLLSTPSQLRTKFLDDLNSDTGCASQLTADDKMRVSKLSSDTDFSIFQSVQLIDALEIHRKTTYYVARFGGPLPPRPTQTQPPEKVGAHEERYVAQLAEVYRELSQENLPHDKLCSLPPHKEHFQNQRIAFYSAEALRLHARDSVPDGTFEALQNDVHSGVIDLAEAPHATGMARLRKVLTAATQIQLDGHAVLLSVSRMDDRKGICHQLANEDRLTWVSRTE